MKRTILYQNGIATEYAFVPESDLVLAKSAHIAQIMLPSGNPAQIYMPKNGVPILLVGSMKDAKAPFDLPAYDELEKLCEEQTYSKYGQAYLIVDAMGRDGVCSFAKAESLRKTIEKNLASNTLLVMIDEHIKTGFDQDE